MNCARRVGVVGMKATVQKYINGMAAGLRSLAVLVFFILGSLSAYAQSAEGEEVYDFRIFFRFDDATFQETYLTNASTLAQLDKVITEHGTDQISSLEIIAYSSPEGKASYNMRLSRKRADAMKQYIVERWPSLEGKITLSPGIDCWDDFRALLAADTVAREETKRGMMALLDRGLDSESLKAALWRHREFKKYYTDYFKSMRYASFRLTFPYEIEKVEEPAPVDRNPIVIPELSAAIGAAALAPKPADKLVSTPKAGPARVRWPLFAVSTNLLQDALITPNFMIEVPIGKRWSVYGEYTFPWWVNKKNNMAWEMLKWDLGARYWPFYKPDESDPMDIMRGHFFGLDLSGGYYDVEPKHKGYQGEFILVGLEYGYAWKLSRDWRLDAFIGAGWIGSQFRYYVGDSTDQHLIYQHSGKFNWFGPTRLGVSIKYIIPYSRVKKEKNK